MSETTASSEAARPELPDGDYAIVELLGHRTLIGRVAEIERFGTKLLQVEAIFQDRLLTPTLHHGNAIYGMTPCSRDVARQRQVKHDWQLPAPLLATIAPDALPAPAVPSPATVDDHPATVDDHVDDFSDMGEPDDEEPF